MMLSLNRDSGEAVRHVADFPDFLRRDASEFVATHLPSKRRQTLLLGVSVDVDADDEGDDVEERHPCLLGQELLGKGKGQR